MSEEVGGNVRLKIHENRDQAATPTHEAPGAGSLRRDAPGVLARAKAHDELLLGAE